MNEPKPLQPAIPPGSVPAEGAGSVGSATALSPAPSVTTQPTPEEQLAQFEAALKEEDWGHQPC